MLLTLEEAITRSETNALFRDEAGTYHGQIADWLIELKKLREENVQLEKMAAWLANQITFCAGYNRIIPCTDGCPICDKQRTARDWLESARQAATEET